MASDLDNTIKNAVAKIAEYINDAATLSVQTEYVRIDGNEKANFDQAIPAALTIIKLDADSRTVIPVRQAATGQLEIDTAIFEVHNQNVNTAIEYRARLVNALLEGLKFRTK
jgi:uncharacterized membrane protein